MNSKKVSVQELCYIGIFAVIIMVSAQLRIPMPYGVPMTLQTLAIPLAGIVLGTRNGTLSVVVYLLLGAFGLPVFSGFSGGLGALAGPTGGFLLSFPFMAMMAGMGAGKQNKGWLAAGLLSGTMINYLCGMVFYRVITSSSLMTAFVVCVLPFIPTAVVKMILAGMIGKNLKTALLKSGLFIHY